MTIRRLVQVLFGVLTALALITAVFVIRAVQRRASLVHLQQQRLRSYQLADELRQSSDDLTRLARTYVLSGDPRYEQYYRDVLAIRQGTKPRPREYNRVYWDFLLDRGIAPRPDSAAVPLRELMRQAGFTEDELALLTVAESRSNRLVSIEEAAFRAMKGEFRDSSGNVTRRGSPDRALAARLISDSAYHHEKALIMKPIDDFIARVTARTNAEWESFRRETAFWFAVIEGLLAVFLLIVIASYPILRNRILNPVRTLHRRTHLVAADLMRLAGVTRGIVGGDLHQSFAVTASPINSTRTDELGDLSRVHDEMIAQLQNTGGSIASITAALSRAHAVSMQRFAAVFQNSPVGLVVSDRDTGTLLEVNPAFSTMVGADSPDQLLGKTVADLGMWSPEDRERRILEPLRSKGRVDAQRNAYRNLKGRQITIEFWASTYEAEGARYVVAGLVDVSDRVALEDQLRQSQKMEAMGKLAGGIAHDFNNLLTVIIGFGELILATKPKDEREASDVREMVKAAQRAAEMTRQLLAFSRKQVVEPRDLDLNATLKSIEKMLRRMIGDDVRLKTETTAGLGVVRADPGQIEQVVANLAVNARDAMPAGGTVTMSTANVELDSAFVSANPAARTGSFVRLSVSDTGTGMSPEVMTRIFEPFFTTKGLGKGTGLGLSTVFGIVQQSEGFTLVRSDVGRGTTFEIYFPRVQPAEAPARISASGVRVVGGSETILVAEDSEALRELALRVLGEQGYTVLSAMDGEAAMELAERHQGPLDLLLTDVLMPGMSGRTLADGLARARPGLKVLYVSGYPDEMLSKYGVLEPGIALLPKPFTPDSLLAKVRDVLDGKAG